MDNQTVYEYIKTEGNNWRTVRIPLTKTKDWNMYEHLERCKNVANGWYNSGNNDGTRPYDDLVTPIINVAFRSEGFDAKDIVPFVDDINENYKSFIVKKLHPQWARKNELDTFIDDLVETSVIYDLALIKNVNNVRPEVVDLHTLEFCDQTDILAGPICLKHHYTVAEMIENKGRWDSDAINQAIILSEAEKTTADGSQSTKTPSKYIEVFELRGNLPKTWLDNTAEPYEYENQMHIVCYYQTKDGDRNGITLYKGKDKPLSDNFKALKVDRIRSRGRACGKSIVETLFEPQVWNNYAAIKTKKLLDSAVQLFQTDSEEFRDQKISELTNNTVLVHESGKPLTQVSGSLQNLTAFQSYQQKQEQSARIIGSASEAQLGTNPTSGTPFALQNLVVQQGQGIHEYRQGKIASFFADVLYRDWILQYMVDEINTGIKFSEELTLEEMQFVADQITRNEVQSKITKRILETGDIPTQEERDFMEKAYREEYIKKGSRKFFETVKDELKDIPMSVMVNIKGKQKEMAQNADKLSNILSMVFRNPQVFQQIPGVSKVFNELLENSGFSAVDFTQITQALPAPQTPPEAPQAPKESDNAQVAQLQP